MRIALILTGKLEHAALAGALGRCFPGHEFVTEGAERPFDGFTSSAIRDPAARALSRRTGDGQVVLTNACKLAHAAFAALRGDRKARRPPADLVVIVDDLEIDNLHQPEAAVRTMALAIPDALDLFEQRFSDPPGGPTARRTLEAALKDRASFHLAVPMPEAWFFTDGQALQRAGVPAERAAACHLAVDCDPEAFAVDDPVYLQADLPCHKPPHGRHPKRFLDWLARPDGYKETQRADGKGGVPALRHLAWPAVLQRPDHMRFLRALFADLVLATGTRPGWWRDGDVAAETGPRLGDARRVLRNL